MKALDKDDQRRTSIINRSLDKSRKDQVDDFHRPYCLELVDDKIARTNLDDFQLSCL